MLIAPRVYDSLNRLRSIGSGAMEHIYQYNAANQRAMVEKELWVTTLIFGKNHCTRGCRDSCRYSDLGAMAIKDWISQHVFWGLIVTIVLLAGCDRANEPYHIFGKHGHIAINGDMFFLSSGSSEYLSSRIQIIRQVPIGEHSVSHRDFLENLGSRIGSDWLKESRLAWVDSQQVLDPYGRPYQITLSVENLGEGIRIYHINCRVLWPPGTPEEDRGETVDVYNRPV